MSVDEREPTMEDVARRAGVSVSTVSRTLRGLASVSPETRRRVEEAARALSFAVSRSASSLASGRTRRIAVLTPGLGSWFVATALSGMAAGLRGSDMDLMVYSVTDMRERAAFFDHLPARRNADALLTVSFALSDRERQRLDDLGMPVVLVSQHAPGRASVYVDDVEGARTGVRHLLNLGHRRIAFISSADGGEFVFSSRDRLAGYRRALLDAGLPCDDALVAGAGEAGGVRRAVGRLLALAEPPTAVFGETDEVALQALGALRERGVDVPGRMSVLGFDDYEFAEAFDLTTLAQDPREIGRTAAGLASSIVEAAADPGSPVGDPAPHIVLPTRLVLRRTTAPPPTG